MLGLMLGLICKNHLPARIRGWAGTDTGRHIHVIKLKTELKQLKWKSSNWKPTEGLLATLHSKHIFWDSWAKLVFLFYFRMSAGNDQDCGAIPMQESRAAELYILRKERKCLKRKRLPTHYETREDARGFINANRSESRPDFVAKQVPARWNLAGVSHGDYFWKEVQNTTTTRFFHD